MDIAAYESAHRAVPKGFVAAVSKVDDGWLCELRRHSLGERYGRAWSAKDATADGAIRGAIEMLSF